MAMIGHASGDERGKISGGKAGDQTGREVCKRSYYVHKYGWFMFRPISVKVANAIKEAMLQAVNNPNIGYDQSERLDIMTALKKYGSLEKIAEPVECDCSSLIRACIYQATGIDVGNFHTGNEPEVLAKSGLFNAKVTVTSSTEFCDGDILVSQKKGHTVAIVEGTPRLEGVEVKLKTLKRGSKGNQVTIFETIMKEMGLYDGDIDQSFGPKCEAACNAFQEKYPECGTNGEPDSTWGPKCWNKSLSLLKV
jgi:hypothetical protein